VAALARRAERAHQRLRSLLPRGTYIVVDSYRNHLRVYRNGELLRDALCSTGSGVVLRDPRDGRQWVFDTPTGERRVQRKVKNPIWAKPDWAFIEEGYEPPPPGSRERFDDFSLGDYGLYMGDGYIIHGTIFQTLLGQRVTHGCIRLGDEDLEYVYRQVPLGARVYLY
jgi:L,D-transpeptidase YbiS